MGAISGNCANAQAASNAPTWISLVERGVDVRLADNI